MGKRRLGDVVRQQQTKEHKTPWDLASEVMDEQEGAHAQTAQEELPKRQIPRTTARISISLLEEERSALEDRASMLRQKGYRDFKTSRLARVAFQMLLDASEEEIMQAAEKVPNLERLRAVRRSDDETA